MLEDYEKIQPEVQKEIQDSLDKFSNERQKDQQYSLSQIQSHAHTGTDSLQVDFRNLVNSSSYAALRTTTLTPAQVKALNTTPVVLVPQLGPPTLTNTFNAIPVVEGITAKIYYGGTAYAGTNSIEFRYGSSSGPKVTPDMDTTFLNQTATVFCHVSGATNQIITSSSPSVVVCVPNANPTTGNSNISFTVKYRVVSL